MRRADAEDVVDIMRACLLDKLLDDTGVLDFRATGSKSKQARQPAHHSSRLYHDLVYLLTRNDHLGLLRRLAAP